MSCRPSATKTNALAPRPGPLRASNSFRVRWRGHDGAHDFGGSNNRTDAAPRAVGSALEKGTFVMKKVLYGTTALVAAGLVAGEASAASGLKLGITGFYRNSIGGTFGNSPTSQHFGTGPVATPGGAGITTSGLGNFDRQNVSMRQEIRVNFTGQTTLDNGNTVGVLVGLNGESVAKSGSSTQVNRAYADFSGKFGLVRVGEANSALVPDCVGDPGNVTSNFGVNSPNESFSDVGYHQTRNQTTGVANVSNSGGGY